MNFLNMIPVFGWLMAAIICFFVAIPIYVLWNWLAPTYFFWLPKVYHELPFWHVFGLLWLISSVKSILLPSFGTTVNAKKD